MSKNLIPKIAELLGVELGEEFKIKGDKDFEQKTFYLTVRGLKAKLDQYPNKELPAMAALDSLLFGDTEIVKLPWNPKMGDTYYSFYSPAFAPFASPDEKNNYKWSVSECIWNDTPAARALLKAGWAFKTKAEAIEALPAAARKEGAEYELPDTEEPWKPEHGREYWSFIRYYYDDEEKLAVTSSYIWTGDVMGRALLKAGWVFRTKEEAEAALPKVAAEMGVEYEL